MEMFAGSDDPHSVTVAWVVLGRNWFLSLGCTSSTRKLSWTKKV